jgi:hypothetical protein
VYQARLAEREATVAAASEVRHRAELAAVGRDGAPPPR